MERRYLLTSLCAFLGGRGSAVARMNSRPPISKNSTRCEVSERVQATMDDAETDDFSESGAVPKGVPSTAPTQK
jgi:hypothetical protein